MSKNDISIFNGLTNNSLKNENLTCELCLKSVESVSKSKIL